MSSSTRRSGVSWRAHILQWTARVQCHKHSITPAMPDRQAGLLLNPDSNNPPPPQIKSNVHMSPPGQLSNRLEERWQCLSRPSHAAHTAHLLLNAIATTARHSTPQHEVWTDGQSMYPAPTPRPSTNTEAPPFPTTTFYFDQAPPTLPSSCPTPSQLPPFCCKETTVQHGCLLAAASTSDSAVRCHHCSMTACWSMLPPAATSVSAASRYRPAPAAAA
jgi:hypothetical protein